MSSSEHRKLRHARVKEILFEACQRAPELRPAFLDGACAGDRELRDEVESLLSYHGEPVAKVPPAAKPVKPRKPTPTVSPLPGATASAGRSIKGKTNRSR